MSRFVWLLLGVTSAGCSGKDVSCSTVCVADGISISASVCSTDPIRDASCEQPEMRGPVTGESVSVVSSVAERSSLVLSVWADGFSVAGPPNPSELGSGVYGVDGALLGVVESSDDFASECSFVGDW